MTDQTTSALIGPTLDDLITEMTAAEAAADYREACVARIRAAVQLGAISARNDMLNQIIREGYATVLTAPAAGDAMTSGLQAADAEGRRLLALLGIDLAAEGSQ